MFFIIMHYVLQRTIVALRVREKEEKASALTSSALPCSARLCSALLCASLLYSNQPNCCMVELLLKLNCCMEESLLVEGWRVTNIPGLDKSERDRGKGLCSTLLCAALLGSALLCAAQPCSSQSNCCMKAALLKLKAWRLIDQSHITLRTRGKRINLCSTLLCAALLCPARYARL